MKRFLFVSIALVGMVAGAPFARANVPVAGAPPVAPDTFTLASLGTLIATWSGSPTALNPPSAGITQTIFGTYQEQVYQSTAPATLGQLSFVEQVNLNAGSAQVDRITASSYAGFTVDVGYVAPTTGTAPNSVDLDITGGTVGFNFTTTPILPSSSSALLVIQTNAKNYDLKGVLSVIDSTTSSNLTFEPAGGTLASTPEPSSMVLAGIGALGMIGYGLRRRKALGA